MLYSLLELVFVGLKNVKEKNSYFTTLTINVNDLPSEEFNVSIDTKIIKEIIEKLKIKGNRLYSEFSKNKSQQGKKTKSIKRSFITNWKKGERIPIDCLETMCKLSSKDIIEIQKAIKEIYLPYSRNCWKVRFPFNLDKKFFLISEAIRTEGCLMKGKSKDSIQGIAISNKDVFLLKLIESKLIELNIEKKSFSRILYIYCYTNKKEDIQSVRRVYDNVELNYNNKNDKFVFLDSIGSYEIDREYEISMGNKKMKLKASVNDDNIVTINSEVHSVGCVSLEVYNSVFGKFLNSIFIIPYGIGSRKTFSLDFPFDINKLPESIIKEVVNIVICCEGHIYHYNKTRCIKIKMGSKIYLEKLKHMLSLLDIRSNIWRRSVNGLYLLTISRRLELIKFKSSINLYSRHKQYKLKHAISSYDPKRITHFEATNYYLSSLRKYEPIKLKELSNNIGKNYNTIIVAFDRLYKQGFLNRKGKINSNRGYTPWIYSLSKKGYNYLNESV